MGYLNFVWSRQVITEVLFSFDIAFAIILIRYLWIKWCTMTPSEFRVSKNVHAAGALLMVLGIGHSILRGWTVLLLVALSHGRDIFVMENQYSISLFGTTISVVGMCWIIRVFSPPKWKERGWIAACIGAALFVGVMSFVT